METGQYICSHENCGKSFSRKDYLIRHQVNHTNTRPYGCSQCNQSFTRSDLLEKHYNSKTHRKKKLDLFVRHEEMGDVKRLKVQEPFSSFELCESNYIPTPESRIDNDLPSNSVGNYLWLFEDQLEDFETSFSSTPDLAEPTSNYKSTDRSVHNGSNDNSEKKRLNKVKHEEIFNLLKMVEFQKFSTKRLNYFLDLYWEHFNPIFPLLHYSTFEPDETDLYLITIMINIGMAHSPIQDEYEISVQMAKVYRRLIFDAVGDKVVLPLSLMQALLFHNFMCKYYGDKLTYEMAQLFHGTNVNFLRFTGYFDELKEPTIIKFEDSYQNNKAIEQWHTWIHYETCKRTAYFAFICDSQHGTLFKHQALSAFALKIDLPCTDAVWNANDAEKFQAEYFRQPHGLLFLRPKLKLESDEINKQVVASGPSMQSAKSGGEWPSFLWSMRSMMLSYKEDQKEYSMDCYSQFSRFIILHGLISICWDMRWRGLFDLGIVSKKKLNDLSGKLQRAFTNWRGYLNLHIANANDYATGNSRKLNSTVTLNDYGLTRIFWANITSFQLALISLYADTASIVKFANDYLISNELDPFKFGSSRNHQLIESWARSNNGIQSVNAASSFIRILLSSDSSVISSIPHIPWTLFISCLVIWSFEIKRDCPDGLQKRGPFELSYFKYTMKPNDVLDEQMSRKDSMEYISLILDESVELTDAAEAFWKRQQLVIGIVAYGLIYLKQIKWKYTSELTKTLNGILERYQNYY